MKMLTLHHSFPTSSINTHALDEGIEQINKIDPKIIIASVSNNAELSHVIINILQDDDLLYSQNDAFRLGIIIGRYASMP